MRECFDVVGGDDVDDKRQEEVFRGPSTADPGTPKYPNKSKYNTPISGSLWLNHHKNPDGR